MHTFKTVVDDNEYYIHYNGDFSGEVQLSYLETPNAAAFAIHYPFEVLKRFVAEYVRSKAIRAFEEASADELLGV